MTKERIRATPSRVTRLASFSRDARRMASALKLNKGMMLSMKPMAARSNPAMIADEGCQYAQAAAEPAASKAKKRMKGGGATRLPMVLLLAMGRSLAECVAASSNGGSKGAYPS